MSDFVVELNGEGAQVAFGTRLARCIEGSALVFLEGDLGAGKTTLVRGFLRGLGHEGAVKSPTYTLIEPYQLAAGSVYHIDLYRVADADELEYLGLREILAETAVTLIEWPERGRGWLPGPDLLIHVEHGENRRRLHLTGISADGQRAVICLQGYFQ